MDTEKYLKRINFTDQIDIDAKTLIQLHEHHVYSIPFENLDIRYGRIFDLKIGNIFNKVVVNFRGGFCYELNNLFNNLLLNIGFKSCTISSRIIDDSGHLGPAYDHMSVCTEINNRKYLLDVGYGDLFIRPLEVRKGIQTDGRNLFKIEKLTGQDYVLLMSSDRINFIKKYGFNLDQVPTEKFHNICYDKQTNPSSYFVKNTICTMPTRSGRLTLFNDKLIQHVSKVKTEKMISNDNELRAELKSRFGIIIN